MIFWVELLLSSKHLASLSFQIVHNVQVEQSVTVISFLGVMITIWALMSNSSVFLLSNFMFFHLIALCSPSTLVSHFVS